MSQTKSSHQVSATTLALAVLVGCTSPQASKVDDSQIKQFSGRGYLSDDRYGIATSFLTWGSSAQPLDITLTVPAGKGPLPLVIYLPALGEGRAAGEAWRTAWAQAGYVVLACQPRPQDAQAWSSPQARAGAFEDLARESYSGPAMAARLAVLNTLLADIRQRQAMGQAPYALFDLNRIALTGHDLGAYTAMTAAGESLPDTTTVEPFPITAVIALSPYADFGGVPFPYRYQAIRVPVLSITSDQDNDALGLVRSTALRRAPFDYMPAGDKLLLTMNGLPHRSLGGSSGMEETTERRSEFRQDSKGRQSPGEQGRNRRGSDGGRMDRDDTGGMPAMSRGLSLTQQALGIAAIQGVSTAFLDAYLRKDVTAREWLDKDATRWLGDKGELKRR